MGREDALKELRTALTSGPAALSPRALSGMGGIGKTQTAIAYALEHRFEYDDIFWIRAETQSEIEAGLESMVDALELPEKDARESAVKVAAARRWLERNDHWLLVLDNADDLRLARDYVPEHPRGHVVLTTRAHAMPQWLRRVNVPKMPEDVGATFVLRRSGRIGEEAELDAARGTDADDARKLSRVMDGLPLALDQAAAYMGTYRCSPGAYLTLYDAEEIADDSFYDDTDHQSVGKTFGIAFSKLREHHPVSAELLRFCAFLAPEAIPEALFTRGAEGLPEALRAAAGTASLWRETVRAATDAALLTRDEDEEIGGGTLSLHRVVRDVLRRDAAPDEARELVETVVSALVWGFPRERYTACFARG
jgi:hypothetical protein